MRALTLHRPWPWAIVHAGKAIENRDWPAPAWMIGEPLAIHAGKVCDLEAWGDMKAGDYGEPAEHVPEDHPLGIVAVCRVHGWIHQEAPGERIRWSTRQRLDLREALAIVQSPWWAGPFGWILRDVRPVNPPIECRGQQGLWLAPAFTVPASVSR